MKKLPIGMQNLAKIIEGGYLYVDKTEYVHRLITSGKYYFLSRPRRFGKSLLVSTLKEIFLGNRELFRNLWIYNRIDWQAHPVIHLDFSDLGHKELGLKTALNKRLDQIAGSMGVVLDEDATSLKFRELINKLSVKTGTGVVLLIDEYDKPIIDYMEDISIAQANRDILRNVYSVIKGSDEFLKLVFLTGVSKFSHVSVFSELNNLADITLNKFYASMLGYTREELTCYFSDYLDHLHRAVKDIYPDIMDAIQMWYNGYSWDARHFVYNPFSIMRLFQEESFANYWYSTGTPTFLLKLLRARAFSAMALDGITIKRDLLDKYEIANIDVPVLLFQTGYLTIKEYDPLARTIQLRYPNLEVETSFSEHLLSEYINQSPSVNSTLLGDITDTLRAGHIDRFFQLLKTLFAGITYQQIENRESYYHSVFYLVLKLIGFDIQCEVLTNQGRIDAMVKTDAYIYVIEFKLGSAQVALEQIKEMRYHQMYMNQSKQVILLGIGFDPQLRNVSDYLSESITA